MMEHKVKLIVVACNTASAVALETVKRVADVPVIGMIIPAAHAALRETRSGNIGVIGTRATVGSKAYETALNEFSDNKKIQIISRACPLFVPLAEEGWLRHEATRIIAEEYLSSFIDMHIDTLVMGCTHYPLLVPLLTEILPGVSLIDSGEHASVMAIRILGEAGLLTDERNEFTFKPDIKFFVTDMPSTFFEVANRFLGLNVESPERINLEKYHTS